MTYRELFCLLADFIYYRQSNENYDPLMAYLLFNIYNDNKGQNNPKFDEKVDFNDLYKKYGTEEIKRQVKSLKEDRKSTIDNYVDKHFKQD